MNYVKNYVELGENGVEEIGTRRLCICLVYYILDMYFVMNYVRLFTELYHVAVFLLTLTRTLITYFLIPSSIILLLIIIRFERSRMATNVRLYLMTENKKKTEKSYERLTDTRPYATEHSKTVRD